MTRTYELALVLDPRLSDEEAGTLVEDTQGLLTTGGAEITRVESWGKRKLAYAINKLTEGRYIFIYLELDGQNPLPEVELRLRQNDKVLRFLTIRTDPDHKRQARKGKTLSPTSPDAQLAQAQAEAEAAAAEEKTETTEETTDGA